MDEITRNIISVLKDTVTLLTENCAGNEADAGEVGRLGGLLLDLIDEVAARVGTYDVRNVDGQSLDEKLSSFYKKVAGYKDDHGQNEMGLKHLKLHTESLNRVLDQDWNASLPQSPGAPAASASNALSPEKDKEKVLTVFEKFTPLKTEKITKSCPFCGQFFGIRSLKNHIRQKHKEEKGEKEKKAKDDGSDKEDGSAMLGTCRMPDKKDPTLICGRRFPSDGIKRHLKEYHSYDCPNKPLRGFTSKGGLPSTPIFLRKNEPDPQYDVMIQALDSSVDDEDKAIEETPTLILEVGPSSKKRLFSEDEKEVNKSAEVNTVDKSAEVDMSLEEQIVLETESNKPEDAEDFIGLNRSTELDMSFEEERAEPGLDKIEQNAEEINRADDSLTDSLDVSNIPRDVVDNFCQDYDKRVGLKVSFVDDGLSNIVDMDHDEDSDYEDGDNPAYSHDRVTRKSERHNNRINLSTSKLAEQDGNKEFIAKFKDFMLNKGLSQKKDERPAHKCFGHIYGYHDSLLEYESKQDEEFFLDRLTAFKSEDFLALKFPLGWLKATCPDDPSRAMEKLKSHKFLRDYLKSSIDKTNFGGSTDDLMKKSLILEGIERISREIISQGLFGEYRRLMQIETVEKRQAKLTVNPSEAHNVANAVTSWNRSKESEERELHFLKIYEDMMSSRDIKSRPFTTLGHYVRFRFAIADKSRPGSYHLLNSDISSCKKLWWPEGYTGFNDLPSGWDENIPPSPGALPSSWSITVSGIISIDIEINIYVFHSIQAIEQVKNAARPLIFPWFQQSRNGLSVTGTSKRFILESQSPPTPSL